MKILRKNKKHLDVVRPGKEFLDFVRNKQPITGRIDKQGLIKLNILLFKSILLKEGMASYRPGANICTPYM